MALTPKEKAIALLIFSISDLIILTVIQNIFMPDSMILQIIGGIFVIIAVTNLTVRRSIDEEQNKRK